MCLTVQVSVCDYHSQNDITEQVEEVEWCPKSSRNVVTGRYIGCLTLGDCVQRCLASQKCIEIIFSSHDFSIFFDSSARLSFCDCGFSFLDAVASGARVHSPPSSSSDMSIGSNSPSFPSPGASTPAYSSRSSRSTISALFASFEEGDPSCGVLTSLNQDSYSAQVI